MISKIVLTGLAAVLIGMGFSTAAFGDHDHGGGGCSGDCVPPTFGTDRYGTLQLENGLEINGNAYTVDIHKQEIPTSEISVGEPVTIKLRVFENQGPENVEHVALKIGMEEEFMSGVFVKSHPVAIHWSNEFGQETKYEVIDSQNLVSDVNVETKIDGNILEVSFHFEFTDTVDASKIFAMTWDTSRNLSTNQFDGAISVVDEHNSESTVVMYGKIGHIEEKHSCDAGMTSVPWKDGTNKCVFDHTVDILTKLGWVIPPN